MRSSLHCPTQMAAPSKPQKRRQLEADAGLHLPEVDLDVLFWRLATRLFVTAKMHDGNAGSWAQRRPSRKAAWLCQLALQHAPQHCRLIGVSAGRPHLHVHPGGVEAGAQRHDLPSAAAALCRLHELCYDAPQRCCPGVVAYIASTSGLIGTMHLPSLHDAQSLVCTVVTHNI